VLVKNNNPPVLCRLDVSTDTPEVGYHHNSTFVRWKRLIIIPGIISIIIGILLLFYYRYFDFFIDTLIFCLGWAVSILFIMILQKSGWQQ
jgi:hypothetical protein